MKSVLFVCDLNICRSQMAQAITNEVYGGDYIADSAGLFTTQGRPMSYDARAALTRHGYDKDKLRTQISKPITRELVSKSDIVVGVTSAHAEKIAERYPEFKDKITTFKVGIPAPADYDENAHDECFFALCREIEKLLYPDGSKWRSK